MCRLSAADNISAAVNLSLQHGQQEAHPAELKKTHFLHSPYTPPAAVGRYTCHAAGAVTQIKYALLRHGSYYFCEMKQHPTLLLTRALLQK